MVPRKRWNINIYYKQLIKPPIGTISGTSIRRLTFKTNRFGHKNMSWISQIETITVVKCECFVNSWMCLFSSSYRKQTYLQYILPEWNFSSSLNLTFTHGVPLYLKRIHWPLRGWSSDTGWKLYMVKNHVVSRSVIWMHTDGWNKWWKCWVNYLKAVLEQNGFGDVWLQQGVGDRDIFLTVFKQRLLDIFRQNWGERLSMSVSMSSRAVFYRSVKENWEFSEYLETVQVTEHRKAVDWL